MSQVFPEHVCRLSIEAQISHLKQSLAWIESTIHDLNQQLDEEEREEAGISSALLQLHRRRRAAPTRLVQHRRLVKLYAVAGGLAALGAFAYLFPADHPVRQLVDGSVSALVKKLPDTPVQTGAVIILPTQLRSTVSSPAPSPSPLTMTHMQPASSSDTFPDREPTDRSNSDGQLAGVDDDWSGDRDQASSVGPTILPSLVAGSSPEEAPVTTAIPTITPSPTPSPTTSAPPVPATPLGPTQAVDKSKPSPSPSASPQDQGKKKGHGKPSPQPAPTVSPNPTP